MKGVRFFVFGFFLFFAFYAVMEAIAKLPAVASSNTPAENENAEAIGAGAHTAFMARRAAMPTLAVTHRTTAVAVDGVTDYGSSAKYMPHVRRLDFTPTDVPGNMLGSLQLDSNGDSAIVLDGGNNPSLVSGKMRLSLWFDVPSGQYYLGDNMRVRCYFVETSETALSGQPFVMKIGSTVTPGLLPKIVSTKSQIEGKVCVPRLELFKNGDELSSVQVRFVNPSNPVTSLRKDEKNNVKRVSGLEVFDADQNVIRRLTVDYEPQMRENIETTVRFEPPFRAKQIYYISVYFEFEDPQGTNSSVTYAWDNRLVWTSSETDPGSENDEAGSGCSSGAFGFLAVAGLVILLMRMRNGR